MRVCATGLTANTAAATITATTASATRASGLLFRQGKHCLQEFAALYTFVILDRNNNVKQTD